MTTQLELFDEFFEWTCPACHMYFDNEWEAREHAQGDCDYDLGGES